MHRLVHVAVVLIVVCAGLFIYDGATYKKPEPHVIERNGRKFLVDAATERTTSTLEVVSLTGGAVGNLILIIDAFRRKYTSRPILPWFLVLAGIGTLFLSPLIYYAVWGWRPLQAAEEVYSDGFCAACMGETTEESAGNTFTVNFLFGTKLIGGAQRCPECLSVVMTKWMLMGVPSVPLGSYRVVYSRQGRYLSRKLPRIHGGHLAWGIGIMGGVLLVVGVLAIVRVVGKG